VEKILFGHERPVQVRKNLKSIYGKLDDPNMYPTCFSTIQPTGFGEVHGPQFHRYDYHFVLVGVNPEAGIRTQAYFIGLTQIPSKDRKERNYSVHLLHVDPQLLTSCMRDYRGPRLVTSFIKPKKEWHDWEYIPLAFGPHHIELRYSDHWDLILYGEDSSMLIPLIHRGRAVAWSDCEHQFVNHSPIYPGGHGRRTKCMKCGLEIAVDTSG